MAPSVAEVTQPTDTLANGVAKINLKEVKADKGPSYPFYYPYFDVNEKFPPTEIFEHKDAGLRADPKKPNLLKEGTIVKHISPFLGTEISGVQLSQLSKEGLDELALYVAERKVVAFRNQDFKDIGPDRQIEIAKHFGPIQRHPTSGNVKGYPEFHVVYRDAENDQFREYIGGNRVDRTSWHSDVSYEKQPPSTTFFFILDQPDVGGDTFFASQVEAYNRLSPEFQKLLLPLRAVHSAVAQAEHSRQRGGPVRREPVESVHPIVRVHPVTGEKALYVNKGFTRRIVGLKDEESDLILHFLFDHIAKGVDFQIRATYEPGTVVVWDNRVTIHSASGDFDNSFRRHAVRLTPQAEVPIPATEP
ncbi:alpha-ketoglutarate catabolism dioxygenase [Abortiporus biennis]|nr:alpha-ketoglutarate catabolism dioxygenase [Abortiporus biennis]